MSSSGSSSWHNCRAHDKQLYKLLRERQRRGQYKATKRKHEDKLSKVVLTGVPAPVELVSGAFHLKQQRLQDCHDVRKLLDGPIRQQPVRDNQTRSVSRDPARLANRLAYERWRSLVLGKVDDAMVSRVRSHPAAQTNALTPTQLEMAPQASPPPHFSERSDAAVDMDKLGQQYGISEFNRVHREDSKVQKERAAKKKRMQKDDEMYMKIGNKRERKRLRKRTKEQQQTSRVDSGYERARKSPERMQRDASTVDVDDPRRTLVETLEAEHQQKAAERPPAEETHGDRMQRLLAEQVRSAAAATAASHSSVKRNNSKKKKKKKGKKRKKRKSLDSVLDALISAK